MIKIAIFASGSGSNFKSIVDATRSGSLHAEVSLLVCDKRNALVIDRAYREGIPVLVFDPKEYETKTAYEEVILKALNEHQVEFIVLAGYMRLLGSVLLNTFQSRIVNIHPSLLPAFPGKDAIGQAFEAGVKVTGVTVHYVDEGMDTGPIIAQSAVSVLKGDDRVSLQARIQETEHKLYPNVLQELFESLKITNY
ncbi:phosphoribosylglycinamide formyltransferase [Peribacillus alkalitolerans]|uniref:phosphoribosylglycinamide formyltransferase n=1 Tax=Peribacillus alkalitolerans TaxID=1550385 RepID=UPI0013D1FDCA|nr:phosphoribosylglycinamide formyltransferase [Peribacillus alkalitolerans]